MRKISHMAGWKARLFHPEAIGFMYELPDGYVPLSVHFFQFMQGLPLCLIDQRVASHNDGETAVRRMEAARK